MVRKAKDKIPVLPYGGLRYFLYKSRYKNRSGACENIFDYFFFVTMVFRITNVAYLDTENKQYPKKVKNGQL